MLVNKPEDELTVWDYMREVFLLLNLAKTTQAAEASRRTWLLDAARYCTKAADLLKPLDEEE